MNALRKIGLAAACVIAGWVWIGCSEQENPAPVNPPPSSVTAPEPPAVVMPTNPPPSPTNAPAPAPEP